MMTKRSGGLVLALAVAVGLVANPLQAQRGTGVRGQGQGPNMGTSLEVLLEKQEILELTGDQLRDLEAMKATMDSEITPLVENIKALKGQLRAGEVDRNEGARQLQALQGELMIASAPLRGRVQEVLTVQQHQTLQVEMRANRPGRGRGGAFQGRGGMRDAPGQLRGGRGGYGPRQGFNGQGRAPAFGFRQAAPGASCSFRNPRGQRMGRGGGNFPIENGVLTPEGY
jgi:Spy/CpxP family protein refolding chaperone